MLMTPVHKLRIKNSKLRILKAAAHLLMESGFFDAYQPNLKVKDLGSSIKNCHYTPWGRTRLTCQFNRL
jgi:hypothetical protein